MGAVFARLPALPRHEAEEIVMREVFAGLDATYALPGLGEIVDTWRPDAIVRDPAEFASYVVAEQRGVPHVSMAIAPAALEAFMLPVVDGDLRDLGADLGADGILAAPVVSMVPPVLDGPRAGTGHVTRVRYDTPPAGDADPLPDWGDPDAPLVYVSYGTVTATVGPFAAVYPATVAALADRPVRVLLTTGDGADVAALGPLPDNVRVERFRPQQAVMPLAAAAIGHGGFGTTMTALVHAVPLVVLPLFAFDQFVNADAVAAAGAGLAVAGEVDGVGRLADAVDAVLADDAYSAGARRIAEEIASQPPVGSAVAVLERLGGQPD